MKESKPVILNTNGHNPVSLFGGSTSAAAIDPEGAIFDISSTPTNIYFQTAKKHRV